MVLKPLFSKRDSKKHFAYSIHSRFRQRAIKANISDTSSITLAVGFPAPCPALVSTWMRSGLVCLRLRPTMYCRVAINFSECRGTTRSSWSAVRSSVEGYWMPSSSGSLILWSGEYLRRAHKRLHIFSSTPTRKVISHCSRHSGSWALRTLQFSAAQLHYRQQTRGSGHSSLALKREASAFFRFREASAYISQKCQNIRNRQAGNCSKSWEVHSRTHPAGKQGNQDFSPAYVCRLGLFADGFFLCKFGNGLWW